MKIRSVGTLHGLQPEYLEDYKVLRVHLDAVICTNRLARSLVVTVSNVSPERVLYAPYGVNLQQPFEAQEARKAQEVGREGLRIAYVGRLEEFQKRITDVCKILKRGVALGLDLSLTVAGGGPDENQFRKLIRFEGLEDRVLYLGVLDKKALHTLVYRKCDVLLLTSFWETGPIVAWEAMSEGLALVTSDYLGRKHEGCLKNGVNCCVFPVGDAEAAVDCMRTLLNRSVRMRMTRLGRKLVVDNYSLERSIDHWSRSLNHVSILSELPRKCMLEDVPPQGRLDRYFNSEISERVRRLLRRRFVHTDPGSEWPHSYGSRKCVDPNFWDLAQQLDAKE